MRGLSLGHSSIHMYHGEAETDRFLESLEDRTADLVSHRFREDQGLHTHKTHIYTHNHLHKSVHTHM